MMKRIVPILAVLAFSPPAVHAQDWGQSFTPGEARDAVRKGDIVPLKVIFASLKQRYGGYQLDAELFSAGNGRSEYRIDWMTGDGRRVRIRVDAETGRILNTSGG